MNIHSGFNRVTYEPYLVITNSFRSHYKKRKGIMYTYDRIISDHFSGKNRPWLKLLNQKR
jgi:hypothetical protein